MSASMGLVFKAAAASLLSLNRFWLGGCEVSDCRVAVAPALCVGLGPKRVPRLSAKSARRGCDQSRARSSAAMRPRLGSTRRSAHVLQAGCGTQFANGQRGVYEQPYLVRPPSKTALLSTRRLHSSVRGQIGIVRFCQSALCFPGTCRLQVVAGAMLKAVDAGDRIIKAPSVAIPSRLQAKT